MIERVVPSRHGWPPSALPAFYGEEPTRTDPWPSMQNAVSSFAAEIDAVRNRALDVAKDLDGFDYHELNDLDELSAVGDEAIDRSSGPMRVVLMGRTMAGKSSLLAAISGSHFDRIGDGRQRFSRDVFAAAPIGSGRIEVVDTPGVGAFDGADDFAMAFQAARDAELVLWVASSDSIQEETARALRLLGVMGKPIIVVLNCRQSLEGVGMLNLLKFPERVFGQREGLVDELKRHMSVAAVAPIDVIYVHALAAVQASARGGELESELHKASRIDDLIDALNREYSAHSESRRVLRRIDGKRRQADGLMLALARNSTTLRAQSEHARKLDEDVHDRLLRVIRSANEGMVADIAIAVGSRRDWHLSVTDFGKSLQQSWESEVAELRTDLTEALDSRFSRLKSDVQMTIAATDAEWASTSSDQFALRDLTGFSSVLGNRMARAGIAMVSAAGAIVGLKVGAALGLTLGLASGPGAIVTTVVGGVIGAGVGIALKPLKGLTDTLILGKHGVLRKRRDEVAEQVGPRLDELMGEYERVVLGQLDTLRGGLARESHQSRARAAALSRLANQWNQHSETLRLLIQKIDTDTATALLRIVGRERLARSVRYATRVPGVCILAEFTHEGFSESWLYPPDLGEKLAGGRKADAGREAGSALSYALSLSDAPARLLSADATSAALRIDAEIPLAITETWSDALTVHLGKHIRIDNPRQD